LFSLVGFSPVVDAAGAFRLIVVAAGLDCLPLLVAWARPPGVSRVNLWHRDVSMGLVYLVVV
jgi:hypothetical protein